MLRLVVDGREGAIPFDVFLDAMQTFLDGIRDVDCVLGRTIHPSLGWTVTALSTSSAAVEVADFSLNGAPPDHGQRVVRRVVEQLGELQAGSLPKDFADDTVKRLRGVIARFDEDGARGLRVTDVSSGATAEITTRATRALELGDVPNYVSSGSVSGTLETINLHRGFSATVYEDVHGYGVRCEFDPRSRDSLLETSKQLLGLRVTASGEVTYNVQGRIKKVALERIEALPADDDLPRVADIFGSAPDLIGGEDPAEYLKRLRHG